MALLSTKPRIGRPARLTGEEMLVCARLHAQGRKAKEIARLVSTPERTLTPNAVAEWLRRAKQPAEDLHMALASLRVQAVENWGTAMARGARDGRHAPAKDLLIATGTIRPDAQDRLVVVIGNGIANPDTLPALPTRTLAPQPDTTPLTLPALPSRSDQS